MRLAAPAIAIASLVALVAGQSKVVQIEDGQVQGPALSACTPYLVVAPPPCPATVSVPKPIPIATTAPCPPIIFEGGALAREYPVGGAIAFCAVAIALAMI